MEITYNLHEYSRKKVYLSLGIGMGMTLRRYSVDDQEFLMNLSVANVWVNYIKRLHGLEYKCSVDRTITFISKQTNQDNMVQSMQELMGVVFCEGVDASVFDQAKKKTIENFENVYKKAQFRGVYKIYEATEWNKEFHLQQLIDDVQSLTYEQFCCALEQILVPSNCRMFVNGSIRDLTDEEVKALKQAEKKKDHKVAMLSEWKDAYLRKDTHLVELAEKPYYINAVSFSFDNHVDMLTRYYYLVIEGYKIAELDKYMHVDFMDASYIVLGEELKIMKKLFKTVVTEKQYEEAQTLERAKMSDWLHNDPIQFGMKTVELQMLGLSLPGYVGVLSRLGYKEYIDTIEKVRPIVCEAQVIMGR